MQLVLGSLAVLRGFLRRLGPYLVLEILLPGGTLLALLLFLYRRRKLDSRSDAPRTVAAMTRALAGMGADRPMGWLARGAR